MLKEIRSSYPETQKITMVFGMSKNKKLENLIEFLENDTLLTDMYLVSCPHKRLFPAEEGYKKVKAIGCSKLRDVVWNSYAEAITEHSS